MPGAQEWLDLLEELKRETIDNLLKQMSVEERIKGLSLDELLAALPPEARAALVQRARENGSPPSPGGN